jgi:hypothetical protein
MRSEDFKLVEYLLQTDDSLMIKRGLQFFCDKVESGDAVSYEQKRAMLRLLSAHHRAGDVLVRRWLYKALGLLPERSNIPFLEGRFREENDFENLAWIIAALAKIKQSLEDIVNLVLSRGFEYYNSAFELASGYFNERYRPAFGRLRKIVEAGDPSALLWVSLVYGKSRGHLGEERGDPKELIRDLNVHDDPRVSEYSIWGLFKAEDGSFADLAIAPQDLSKFSSNIRRWYYRLLAKAPESVDANFDLVQEASRVERAVDAREGLAIGLATTRPDAQIAGLMIDWHGKERNPLVRARLLEHLTRFQSERSDYRDVIAADREIGPYERRWMAVAEDAGRALVEEVRNVTSKPSLSEELPMAIPIINTEEVRQSYVLAVDTVDFSDESDDIQLNIFRDLLQDFGSDRILRGVRREDLVPLLTGDGLIVVAGGDDNRLLPLQLSLSIIERYQAIREKKIRCGVNSGPAHWMVMSDGSRQVIGHAVNWAARVMAAAGGNEVFVSEGYFGEIARPARSELKGINFEEVAGLFTKKGEPIPARRASY